MTAWMTSTAAVHVPAANTPVHKLDMNPTVATRSRIISEAEILFCAYWRSSSWSNAGRIPLDEVNLSRASRTYCAASRRFTGEVSGGSAARSGSSPGIGIDGR
jgi:hypothetical protein